MEKSKSEIIQDKRSLNMMSLDTYVLDMQNALDNPIDKLIIELGNRLKQNWKEHDDWMRLENENPKKYLEHKENASNYGHSLDEQMHHYILEIIDLEEEITALLEVKIIYAFKHFEINLKRLIKAAYEDDNFVKNYKWETIKQYFSLKKIDIKLVTNYNEVNQLRELNNAIKHSENYFTNENLKGLIPEFNKKNPGSRELYKFYKRVEKCSTNFIQSISQEIYEDLYNFDDNKIEGIAESLAMRMDKKNVEKLILKLKEFS